MKKKLKQFLQKHPSIYMKAKNLEGKISLIQQGEFRTQGKIHLPNKILVGTHHKTGTKWMNSIFTEIAALYNLSLYGTGGRQEYLPRNWDIFFQNHSEFNLSKLQCSYRGIHLIRDPRDVIISATFYHQRSKEHWLHVPTGEFNGLTYQEKINTFSNIEDQILFEMENRSKDTLSDLHKWDYNNDSFIEVKYENLIQDSELELFRRIFSFLNFPEEVIPEVLNIAYRNSLFSGNIENSTHVRSGEAKQYKQYFTSELKESFMNIFGDILLDLGYEDGHDW